MPKVWVLNVVFQHILIWSKRITVVTEYEPKASVVYVSSGYLNSFYPQRIFINFD